MSLSLHNFLIATAMLGCAVMAGVYFAFSSFVMRALAGQHAAGADTMRAINEVILQSSFMPLFFGTALACVVLAGMGGLSVSSSEGKFMLAGSLIYLVGMVGCTMAFNVPLNDQLASSTGASGWESYVSSWSGWNNVRTVSSGVASILLFLALRHD